MDGKIITVIGGSGFVGRHLVRKLLAQGALVRVAVRDPEAAKFLVTMGDVGQVTLFASDIKKEKTIEGPIRGSYCVINLVGILSEWGGQNFDNIHAGGAATVAKMATDAGVKRFVHMSALGASSESLSAYAKTKTSGELHVKKQFPNSTIIRPSVIFGPEDSFFNLFAGMARLTFAMPVFGCPLFPKISMFKRGKIYKIDFFGNGGTKFQPVYVGDVADAIISAIASDRTKGKTYELGGPDILSSVDIIKLILKNIGRKRLLIPIPFWYLSLTGWFLQKFPNPLLTLDQVRQLKVDNVVSEKAQGFKNLGIDPMPVEAILPNYLKRYRKSGYKFQSSNGT